MPSGPDNNERPSSFTLTFALTLIVIMWSLNYFAGKIALRHIDPLSLAVLRNPLSTILMAPIYFMYRPKERRPLHFQDFIMFGYLSFFGVIVAQGLFTIGLAFTTSEHSVIVRALGPIFALLIACLCRMESLNGPKIVGMFCGFVGVVLLELQSGHALGSGFVWGDLLTAASILGFAICAVLGRRVARDWDPISLNMWLSLLRWC